jgi:DNA-nicking Smr family endonuclease
MTRKPTKPTSDGSEGVDGSGLASLRRLRSKVQAVQTRRNSNSGAVAATQKTRSRAAALTDDERDDWEHVAETVAPVRTKRSVPLHDHLIDPAKAPMPPRRQPDGAPAIHHTTVVASSTTVSPTISTVALGDFEPRLAKRIGRGHKTIDARLDLHGDRQGEAHVRLRAFLLSCYGRGQRTVLVITGKGRETDQPSADDIGFERRERGVLKRNVPRWLSEPDMRAIVVSYTTAHVRHGGEGALYVQLRRKR